MDEETRRKKGDYRVAALNKGTDAKNVVGRAWKKDDGTIQIVLDYFVVLHGGKELLLTLFLNDDQNYSAASRPARVVSEKMPRGKAQTDFDDEIPF